MHVAFVDFRKAFDSVRHCDLLDTFTKGRSIWQIFRGHKGHVHFSVILFSTVKNRDKDRYFPYRSVKSIFEPEQYLSILEMKCFRVRFLATTTWCATNSQRSSSLQILCYTEKLCILCESDRNEERLFICPLYLDMREKRMDNTSRLSKLYCLRKARQRCLDWASLFPMRLGEETSLQGQTSFTM